MVLKDQRPYKRSCPAWHINCLYNLEMDVDNYGQNKHQYIDKKRISPY